jgi:hypothetical protein
MEERSSSPSQQGSTANPTGNQDDDDAYLDGYYTGDNGSNRSGIINGAALLKSVTSGSYSSDGEPSLKSPDQQFPAQIGFSPDAIINQPIVSELQGIETNVQRTIGNAESRLASLVGNQSPTNELYPFPSTAATPEPAWQPDSEDLKYMGEGLKLGMKVMSHVHIPGGNNKSRNGGLRSRLASMVNGKSGEKSHSPSTDTHEGQNEVG